MPGCLSGRKSEKHLQSYAVTVHTIYLGEIMHIESLRHKGLRQLYLDDVTKGVPAHLVDRLKKQLFAMETAANLDQLNHFPGWRLHPLKGDLADCWSLSVSGNWRLIFQYDGASNTASLLDLLDYH